MRAEGNEDSLACWYISLFAAFSANIVLTDRQSTNAHARRELNNQ